MANQLRRRRAQYDAAFIAYRRQLAPVPALNRSQYIQLQQEQRANMRSFTANPVSSDDDSVDQRSSQEHEPLYPSLDPALFEFGSKKVAVNQSPKAAPFKVKTPWSLRKKVSLPEAILSSQWSTGFVQYTNDDYKNHVDWSEKALERDFKRKKSMGQNSKETHDSTDE